MLQFLNFRMRVTMADGRTLVGTFLAFDKHMNLVLADTQEFRKLKTKKGTATEFEEREETRTLGLVLLRGENVVSIQVESAPKKKAKTQAAAAAAGRGEPVGRGAPLIPGLMPPGMMPPPPAFTAAAAGRGMPPR